MPAAGAIAARIPGGNREGAAPAPPDVPENIRPGDGHKVFLKGHAVGVQIYRCNPTATGHAWQLVAPRADLYGDNGKVVVTHSAGPSWQAKDGSKIVASRVDGVDVAGTIPWLLLKATPASVAPEGTRLAGTTHIQRVDTVGGRASAPETWTP